MAVIDSAYKIIAKPNCSLSQQQGLKLLVAIFMLSMGVALGCMLQGAWLVVPFAGLEVAAFAYAFHVVFLHANDYESIEVDAEQVVVEQKVCDAVKQSVFQRHWVRVRLEQKAGRSALLIGSHGKEVEFGKSLVNDEQRAMLVRDIKKKLASS